MRLSELKEYFKAVEDQGGDPEVTFMLDADEFDIQTVLHFPDDNVLWLCAPDFDEEEEGPPEDETSELSSRAPAMAITCEPEEDVIKTSSKIRSA